MLSSPNGLDIRVMLTKIPSQKNHSAIPQKIVEQMLDGILILKYPSGVIQNANDAIVFFCGMTRSTLIGKNFWDLNMLVSPTQTLDLYEQIIQKRAITIQQAWLRPAPANHINADIYGEMHTFENHESLILLRFENKGYAKWFKQKISALPLDPNESINSKFQFLLSAVNPFDTENAKHQRNVSRLATAIAEELGLSVTMINRIMMSALVHDIGKIAIPKEILNKSIVPTIDEAVLIKNHVKVAYDVLKRLLFPLEIANVVLQHHERLDGSGYPNRLIKSEICQEAKVLMVADTVAAMLHSRTYRREFDLEISLHQLEVDQYSKLAPDVVNVCAHLFRKKRFSFDHSLH